MAVVERRLVAGGLACPDAVGAWAGGGLGASAAGVVRQLRGDACAVVGGLLLRRVVDAVVVIGAALLAKAGGVRYRRIVAGLGRSLETVRSWLRRFAGRLEVVRHVFTCCRGRWRRIR